MRTSECADFGYCFKQITLFGSALAPGRSSTSSHSAASDRPTDAHGGVTNVPEDGEAKIAASRERGERPREGKVPIGVTGFTLEDE